MPGHEIERDVCITEVTASAANNVIFNVASPFYVAKFRLLIPGGYSEGGSCNLYLTDKEDYLDAVTGDYKELKVGGNNYDLEAIHTFEEECFYNLDDSIFYGLKSFMLSFSLAQTCTFKLFSYN